MGSNYSDQGFFSKTTFQALLWTYWITNFCKRSEKWETGDWIICILRDIIRWFFPLKHYFYSIFTYDLTRCGCSSKRNNTPLFCSRVPVCEAWSRCSSFFFFSLQISVFQVFDSKIKFRLNQYCLTETKCEPHK